MTYATAYNIYKASILNDCQFVTLSGFHVYATTTITLKSP